MAPLFSIRTATMSKRYAAPLSDLPRGDPPSRADEVLAAARAGGTLTIDLAAIVANWRLLRQRAAPAACAAVVKANAYGCGLAEVGAALAAAGCDTFFVAVLAEAILLRRVCPAATIYVLNGLARGQTNLYLEHELRPVLGSTDEIAEWRAFATTAGARPAAIQVDTGMNRLGLPPQELATLVSGGATQLGFSLALLMSHFVTSDNAGHPLNARQIDEFRAARALVPAIPASLANSSGVFLGTAAHHDLVRPGYALYGGNPTPSRDNPMRDVVTLTVPIVQVRLIEEGATVGYDAQWTAGGQRRIATIPIGYADGYPRGASATHVKQASSTPAGEAVIAGRRCPFAGRVSMDLITIDVSDIPESAVRRGDPVTLIGEGLSIDEVGMRAGTIGYEILTRLGQRYERRYLR
jgi:alanine racemase